MKYVMLDEKVKEDENRNWDYYFNQQLSAICEKYGLQAVIHELAPIIGGKMHSHAIKTVGWLGGKAIATVYCPCYFDDGGRFAKGSSELRVRVWDHSCYDTIQKIMGQLSPSISKEEKA